MGMYLKQQQRNSQLQDRLASDLDQRLNKKTQPADVPHEEPMVSFRWVWFVVLTSGGFVAIVLALLQRQDPKVIGGDLNATLLASAGVVCIILGCLSFVIKRHHKNTHV